MKPRWTSVLACTCVFATISPGVPSAEPLSSEAAAPINAALAAVDTGSRSRVEDEFTPDATIIDEISPFRFTGERAAFRWFDRLTAANKANGRSCPAEWCMNRAAS